MKRFALMAFAVVAASGCGGDSNPGTDGGTTSDIYKCDGAEAVTTAQLQSEIFATRCATCHTTDTPSQPGNMTTTAQTQALVGKASNYATTAGSTLKYVDPNNLQNSTMYLKVLGHPRDFKGPKGEIVGQSRMPQGSEPLTDAQIGRIKSWICTGAVQQ